MPRVLIVDDHPFIRAGVKLVLSQEGFEVVGEAEDGTSAVRMARELLPDLIILDISIPRLDGLEVIGRLNGVTSGIKVLALTSQSAECFAPRCLKAGASGFISKSGDLSELVRAAKSVLAGYTYFPAVAVNSVRRTDMDSSEADRIASLSDRELLILQYLTRGLSNKEIGDSILLSNKTISTYKARVIEKLNVKTLVDLVDLARRNGLS
ncbi:Virulence factors putative positive transcription regulator BvgA [Pseudomonas fluorescens]|jgi:two-component system response regulator EvgA|uniref:Virulence factors putative positive transcription regulator BvgA n=1 Tax=Pseudomonas fluorescens TaxID=294 RepID=A0A5E7V335_PSEFL|nr:response regulator transcription factor [Pseudomonas fluorescens]VVQ18357.1 Virulence factors putative positive transcription regulator BvgA [Pseudomonas fluorescens]